MKCDAKKPACQNCIDKQLHCRPADPFLHSEWCQNTSSGFAFSAQTVDNEQNVEDTIRQSNCTRLTQRAPHSTHPVPTWDLFTQSPTDLDIPTPLSALIHDSNPTISGDSEVIKLLNIYQRGIAKWMDLFDFGLHYQRELLRRVLDSSLLVSCICALSAK